MPQISYDDFQLTYKPVTNHIDDNASFDGRMFETYGPELEHVLAVYAEHPLRVWTIVDNDEEPVASVLVQGMAFVNRIGFIITENDGPAHLNLTVLDD